MKFWNDDSCVRVDKELLDATYDAYMNVIIFETVEKDGFAEEEELTLYSDIPCGISFLSGGSAKDTNYAEAESMIKVFCPDDIDVPVGAVLDIVYLGQCFRALRCGYAKHYSTHREFTAVIQSN